MSVESVEKEYVAFTGSAIMEIGDDGFPHVTMTFEDMSPMAIRLRDLLAEKLNNALEDGGTYLEVSVGSTKSSWRFRVNGD
jgi:hypothetical protein